MASIYGIRPVFWVNDDEGERRLTCERTPSARPVDGDAITIAIDGSDLHLELEEAAALAKFITEQLAEPVKATPKAGGR